MTGHTSTFGPVRWTPAARSDGERIPGVWTKELLSSPHGDSFSLLRFGPGAEFAVPGSPDDRILVLDGELSIGGVGAYRALPGDGTLLAGSGGALALVLKGERLGAPAADVFGPDGWRESSPGVWFRLLLDVTFDENFDERVVGLSHFEPGATAPRHPHPTAHRFLFLDGEADDELVFPDGTRQTAHRVKGDFVDYPYPVEHQTFSRTGCTILFLHEPVQSDA
ncbi:cupin domain-containing protein [Amycolatopsis samaneae]|uniref:Cupin domain-containing protein n=1 Tax=Amycolatopsis samaneae TaxID=664691 RepID=A0ABW5GM86_9PSEU